MHPSQKIHKAFYPLIFLAAVAVFQSCDRSKATQPPVREAFENIIPAPVSASPGGQTFFLSGSTTIFSDTGEAARTAEFIASKLRPATGFDLGIRTGGEIPSGDVITLTTRDGDPALGEEGYEMTITEDQVKISAYRPAGLFFGAQTLRQLLPAQIESASEQNADWEIATGTIRDAPRFSWRGSMLDVARHFFPVEDVKRYIDMISYYKMNRLHLHLSDDQGWRIEIKSWPNLTGIGSKTQVGGGKGGFYTQEQYKDIVAYAQRHYITIIPEIDMPGHINAALVSYTELNVNPSVRREPGIPDPKAKPVPGQYYTGTEVGFSTLDIKKPVTFRFVEDVLGELAAITPGPYLHIGGDEAAVTKKPDYISFVNRFRKIVEANGKRMIGWEEVAQADLDSTAIVQYWHSAPYAKMAAEKGAKLIFSPSEKVYLDMQYDSTTRLGLHWAAYIEVDASYSWDPGSLVPGLSTDQILGVEAPLWTETIVTMDDIEYMVFPRLAGVAEIGWSDPGKKSWDEYKVRLARHAPRWDFMEIDYYESPVVPWQK